MKLSTSLVAVKKITSTVPRSNFTDSELEKAAQLILQAEGVISPIVLQRTSLNSYEVVDGDFEYYAAARAREIDPRKGEMIGSFIVEEDNEEVIKKQVELLRKPKATVVEQTNSGSTSLELRLTNLESRIENRIQELKNQQVTDRQKLENEITELRNQIPTRLEPLEIFNNMSLPELAFRLKSAGLSEKKAAQIAESIEKERKKNKFNSLSDIVARVKIKRGQGQIKGISSDRMVEIISNWSQLLFR
ncbi:MAG: hypothetical protein F6K14_17170 [Symploca sp. SIO2C1]|nr:hypothetical protein [Symploca sp. SIO2C1]